MAIIRQAIKGCGANEANEGNEGEEGCRGQYSCFLIGGEGHTGTSTEAKNLKRDSNFSSVKSNQKPFDKFLGMTWSWTDHVTF